MKLSLPKMKFGNITMREIEPADYMGLFRVCSKEEVCRYMTFAPYKKPEEALFVITKVFYKRPEEGIPVGYAIFSGKEFIGMIDYHTKNENENSIQLGYFLDPDYQGLGIMRKCILKVIEYAFDKLGYDKIVVGAFSDNDRSLNLMNKTGFKYEYEEMIDTGDDTYKLAKYYSLYKNDFMEG